MPQTLANDLSTLSRSSGFPRAAFEFVDRGLAFTVERIHGQSADEMDHEPICEDPTPDDDAEAGEDRHITGVDLCFGLRDYAIDQYGMLAPLVLKHWGVTRTEHFGMIVFAMVEAGRMHKTDDDTLDDFCDVFEFRDAFAPTELMVKGA